MNCLYCCTVLTNINHKTGDDICHNCKQNQREVIIQKKQKLKERKKSNGKLS